MLHSYIPEPVTERIRHLREEYKRCPVATQKRPFYYSSDRWISLPFLRGWEKHAKEPTLVLRHAYAEAEELLQASPVVVEGELIVGQLDFHDYTPEEQAEFDRLYEAFISAAPRGVGSQDHICLDYEKLLRVGVNGLISEIREKRAALCFDSESSLNENLQKEEFYCGCLIELEALLDLEKRYAEYVRGLAEKCGGERRAELLETADILDRVPANPAHGYREALQSMHFFTYNLFGLYPIGRPDRFLFPYYMESINDGSLTRAQAQELTDQYCLLISTYVFSRAACGFMVGGRDFEGKLVENDLTWMFLTAIDHVRMPDPNAALVLTEETDRALIHYATELVSAGLTHPSFYNDTVISESLRRLGYDEEDVHNFIHTTCAEISICGKSRMYTTSPFHNIVRMLDGVLEERDDWGSIDEIKVRFAEVVRQNVSEGNKRVNLYRLENTRNGVEPLRVSCLIDNCIERGRSIAQGGAKYNRNLPDFVGFGNVCDMFIAIDHLVFREKKLTLPQLRDIAAANYAGHEDLRRYIINKLPHYGNDDPEVIAVAGSLSEILRKSCEGEYTLNGGAIVPGMFSYMVHSMDGAGMKATADGRLSGESLSDGAGPVQGRDTTGPTSLIRSLTCWKQSDFLGGMVVNLKFTKSLLNERAVNQLEALICTFMKCGGMQLQINVTDAETLRDAMEHPERHRDLIVRIGGYSDYFVRLDPAAQLDILNRTSYDL